MGMLGTFNCFVGIVLRERAGASHGMGVRDGWFVDGDIFEFEYNKNSWMFSPMLACLLKDCLEAVIQLLVCLSVCLSVCWCC